MSLKLIPPGARRNKYWWVRGQIGEKRIEVSTQTTDKAAAQGFALELEHRLRLGLGLQETRTFADVVDSYLDYRKPNRRDEAAILRLRAVLGLKPIEKVVPADLHAAAEVVLPLGKPTNRNRWVMRPGAVVLHYAATNNWCPWHRVRLFKEPKPVTRATTVEVAQALIEAAPKPEQKLLLLWLFKHGDRISDAINIKWDNIDLQHRIYRHYEQKNDKWRRVPLDDEVAAALLGLNNATGFVFPWRQRHSVYNWLRPLTKRLGVKFTPHMARHTVGTMLVANGVSQRTIMERLGHADYKSSMRYQGSDVEVIRSATNALPKLGKVN